ncbi:E3 ubiquitin-protein ligase MARCH7 isoform X2 [Trichomycterus rosablanca]|uniref:E3 ubiquitin-protein ligase MARCH7 isoform X2 n=1 Tax=Trichomycterus rosablanca TaxID=2290929 RepID=UPI002F350327
MDSKPRRLPFTVSSSSSISSTSSFSSSASALSAGRLYGRGTVLGSDRFSRGATGKLDSDYQSSRIPGSSRDYSSSESYHSRWKLSMPLSSSSSSSTFTSSDRPWAESSYGGRSKPVESERGFVSYSNLLGTTQDDESKRAKLSYTNRQSYSRHSTTSTPSSTYSSLGGGMSDSLWKSSLSPLSRSSSSSSSSSDDLWARRDVDKRTDSGLGEASYRPTSLSSSLYRPERVTSTYAQGARPKESLYSSSRRENNSSSRRLSSDYVPSSHRLSSDYHPSPRLSLNSARNSSSLSDPSSLSSWSSSPYTPLASRSSSPPPSSPATVPSPTSESGDSDGRSTTRRLLSRLFSRRPSQESSSASVSSSASRSFDSALQEASPSDAQSTPGRESTDTELRSSWLNWNRCNPLFSRRRREGRDESARMEAHPTLIPLSSPEERKTTSQDTSRGEGEDEEEEEEDELSEGATAASPPRASGLSSLLQEAARLPGQNPGIARVMTSPLFRMPQNVIIGLNAAVDGQSQAEVKENERPAPSRDPERLKKIQESLLLEDSDEDEGDLCRICQMGETSSSNPLIEPCRCTGSLQYVHQDCIKKWLRSKITSGSNLEAITTCELCKDKLHLNIENFDINELYRSHERSEYEFISCGLYLVVLLHLCEQRFSDVLGAVNEAGAPMLNRMKRHVTIGQPLTLVT